MFAVNYFFIHFAVEIKRVWWIEVFFLPHFAFMKFTLAFIMSSVRKFSAQVQNIRRIQLAATNPRSELGSLWNENNWRKKESPSWMVEAEESGRKQHLWGRMPFVKSVGWVKRNTISGASLSDYWRAKDHKSSDFWNYFYKNLEQPPSSPHWTPKTSQNAFKNLTTSNIPNQIRVSWASRKSSTRK